MPTLAPDSFSLCRRTVVLRRQDASPAMRNRQLMAIRQTALSNKMNALFADAKSQGIANPVMVGAIPFDTRQPSSLFIPQSWQSFSRTAKQQSSRYFTAHQSLNVVERKSIPEQDF